MKYFLVIVLVTGVLSFKYNPNSDPYQDYAWIESIYKGSPRLFFNYYFGLHNLLMFSILQVVNSAFCTLSGLANDC